MVQADGEGARVGSDAADERPGRVGGEGEGDLDLAVAREALRLDEIGPAAPRIEPEGALIAAAQRPFEIGRIANQQRRRIDQEAAGRLGFNRQRRDHRSRKGLLDTGGERRVARERSELEIALDDVHARTRPLESDHRGDVRTTAIDAEIDRANPFADRDEVQQVFAQPRDFEEDAAAGGIDVDREVSLTPLEAGRPLGVGLDRLAGRSYGKDGQQTRG